jgi:response regulator RpfG family c-di-GMP phosphodiesterase
VHAADDELVFAPETAPRGEVAAPALPPWRVLVVDDEPDVHRITARVLGDYRFRGRGLTLISAYSAAEARRRLAEIDDLAVIIVDVVMETERAGLDLVRHIRDERGDRLARIVLRTGQPGSAPERDVILAYDIDDYREKSELTATRLFTMITTALRAYVDLTTIERSRRGLAAILAETAELFKLRSLASFLAALPDSLCRVLALTDDKLVCWRSEGQPVEAAQIVAASGGFTACLHQRLAEITATDLRDRLQAAFRRGESRHQPRRSTIFQRTQSRHEVVMLLEHDRGLSDLEQELAALFCAEAAVGLDNIYLFEQLKRSEQASVLALAKCAEFKDDTTGRHVLRVCGYTRALIAELRLRGDFAGSLTDAVAELAGLASVLHDVGKVGIPDAILGKQDRLDDGEFKRMRQHPEIGESILKQAAAMVDGATYLSVGAEIAAAHHERFDGQGYPRQLSGEDIPLAARILSVVDVFDALTTRRPYKAPWTVDDALRFLEEQAGSQFDPVVVRAFVDGVKGGRIRVDEGGLPDVPVSLHPCFAE